MSVILTTAHNMVNLNAASEQGLFILRIQE